MAIYAQLSCEMPRDPRLIAAGWQARAVYVEALLYCRENLTDGTIDRLALIFWMPDMPVKARSKLLDALVAVGALEVCPAGWRFPSEVWRRWNPTKDDIESLKGQKAAAGARGNHKRWKHPHEFDDCPLCHPGSQTIAGCETVAIAGDRHTQRERDSDSERVSPSQHNSHPAPPDDGTDGRLRPVIELITERLTRQHPARIPGAAASHAAVIANDVRSKHGDLIARRLAQLPNSTPATIATSLEREIS